MSAPWEMLSTVLQSGPVDRVEPKALLDARFEHALKMLGGEVDPPRVRQIHYLDTPDLALLHRGVTIRTRSTNGRAVDVVVKVRRSGAHAQHGCKGLSLELDALPGDVTWAASLRRRPDAGTVARAIESSRPARQLLSRAQPTPGSRCRPDRRRKPSCRCAVLRPVRCQDRARF